LGNESAQYLIHPNPQYARFQHRHHRLQYWLFQESRLKKEWNPYRRRQDRPA
jgi:hypothetical protein